MTPEERLIVAVEVLVFLAVYEVIIEREQNRAIRALGYSKTGDICTASGIYISLCADPGWATVSAGEKFPQFIA